MRTKDFKVYCEKKVLNTATDFELEISSVIFELLDRIFNPNILYRSTGVILDTFVFNHEAQMSLFADAEIDEKKSKLAKCFDNLEVVLEKILFKQGS